MSQDSGQPAAAKARSFLANVFWTWSSLLVNLAGVLVLSPYLLRRLGDEAYGVWALSFSVVEYYLLLDGGFKSAVIKQVGGHRARGEYSQIQVVMNTALVWFFAISCLLCLVTWTCAGWISRFFQVSEPLRADFRILLLLVGTAWSVSLMGLVFMAGLEAFQQFHLTSRLVVLNGVLRTSGLFLLLASGYGLREMGILLAILQVLFYSLAGVLFFRVFPAFRLSPGLASRPVLKKLFVFGWDTLPSTLAWLLLLQGPSILIGRMLSATWAGYFSFPQRIVQQAINFIHNVGSVTSAKSAELAGRNEKEALLQLAIQVNRACFTLYGAFAVLMVLYGRDLLTVWLRHPSLIEQAAPVLPILAAGLWLSDAGQFNTSSMLFGIGRHRWFSRFLLLESLIALSLMAYLLPRFGLVGLAWGSLAAMVAHRGLLLPWIFCREMKTSWRRYMAWIYPRPMGVAAITWAVGTFMRSAGAIATNWFQLGAYTGILAALYVFLAWRMVLDEENRVQVRGWIASKRRA